MRTARTKFFALLLSICMLASLLVVPVGAAEFSDVPDWATKSVDRWTEAGIMEGNEDGTFDSTHEMTRAEFAIILCKLMGYTEKADPSMFTDLPEDQEAADALLKLAAAGVMLGIGNNLASPNGTLTREQTAVMMFRALNMKADPKAGEIDFPDAEKVSDWAKPAMATMTNKKMMEGDGTNLIPLNNIAKQDMAALLDKMIAVYVSKDGKVSTSTIDEAVTSKVSGTRTTISAGENPGAVIINSKNVTIADAANSGSIVVAPGAPAGTTINVTGAASDITVAAEGAKVTVAKGAEVASVAVEAPKAGVTVSGTVGDVTVAEGADNTTVTAMSGSKVDSVTTNAESVKVNGAKGTIGTVVANAGSADVKAKGAEVKNDGAQVKVDNKVVASGSTATSNQVGSGTSTSTGGGSSTPVTPPIEDPDDNCKEPGDNCEYPEDNCEADGGSTTKQDEPVGQTTGG